MLSKAPRTWTARIGRTAGAGGGGAEGVDGGGRDGGEFGGGVAEVGFVWEERGWSVIEVAWERVRQRALTFQHPARTVVAGSLRLGLHLADADAAVPGRAGQEELAGRLVELDVADGRQELRVVFRAEAHRRVPLGGVLEVDFILPVPG